ncbi:MAG: IS630 transposase-related protein [Fusobacteria bacterium]|nr:IS630 transposase-related protein [Fusobacteriota bacterium]
MAEYDNKICVQKIAKMLKLSRQTLYTWIKKRELEGDLNLGYFGNKNAQKIDVEKVKQVVKENPDLYLLEIVKIEKVGLQAIYYCLKREQVTHKKIQNTKNEMKS